MNPKPFQPGERVFTRPLGGVGAALSATVDDCSCGNVFLCFDDDKRSEWRHESNVWRREEASDAGTPPPAPVVFTGAQGHFEMEGE